VKPFESNFKCDICSKAFMAIEFVKKHVKNKHKDVVEKELKD
jgi:hypothetical protein